MGRNSERAEKIRKITYGRDNREPIAKSLEKTNKIVQKTQKQHDTRIVGITTEEIPGMADYYSLEIVHGREENG